MKRVVFLLFSGLLVAGLLPLSKLLAKDAAAAQAPATVTINIDAARVGVPISKYIYGQFIEHLGRCIYGGIWAEMLEDRKFFYPVGSEHSPWKAVGPADAVTMVREGAFVGEHSPRIALAGGRSRGIVQDGTGPGGGQELRGPHLALAEQARRGPGQPRLGRRGGRPANGPGSKCRQRVRQNGVGIHRRPGHDQRPAGNLRHGRGHARRRHREPDASRQRPGHEGRHAGAAQGARRPRLSLARRQFRQRIQLARRAGRLRSPPAAEEPRVERRRGQRFRHRRVHDLLPPAGHRPLHHGQQRPGRRRDGRRRTAIRQCRGDHAHGQASRRKRPRRALSCPLLVDRQRDVRKLATRPHAAGKVRRRSTMPLPRRCGPSTPRSRWLPWATWGRGAKACSSTAPGTWT